MRLPAHIKKSLNYAVVDANRHSQRLQKNSVSEMQSLVYRCRKVFPGLQVQKGVPWSTGAGRSPLVYRCRKAFPGL